MHACVGSISRSPCLGGSRIGRSPLRCEIIYTSTSLLYTLICSISYLM
jgi:hypothetical protein